MRLPDRGDGDARDPYVESDGAHWGANLDFLIVFVGAGLGGACRHAINLAASRLLGPGGFPFGTLFINVVGSALIGVIAEAFALRGGAGGVGAQSLRLFLTTGILGGFTTFSAFSLDAAVLYGRGEVGAALAYVLASVVLSLGGLFGAMALLRLTLGGGS